MASNESRWGYYSSNPRKDPYYKGLVKDLQLRMTRQRGEIGRQQKVLTNQYDMTMADLGARETAEMDKVKKQLGARGLSSSGIYAETLGKMSTKYAEERGNIGRTRQTNVGDLQRQLQELAKQQDVEQGKFLRERGYERVKEKEDQRRFEKEYGLKDYEAKGMMGQRNNQLAEEIRQANLMDAYRYAALRQQGSEFQGELGYKYAGLGQSGSQYQGDLGYKYAGLSAERAASAATAANQRRQTDLGYGELDLKRKEDERAWAMAQAGLDEGGESKHTNPRIAAKLRKQLEHFRNLGLVKSPQSQKAAAQIEEMANRLEKSNLSKKQKKALLDKIDKKKKALQKRAFKGSKAGKGKSKAKKTKKKSMKATDPRNWYGTGRYAPPKGVSRKSVGKKPTKKKSGKGKKKRKRKR